MAQRKYPRVELDQRVYDALQAESSRSHKSAREMATEALERYLPKDVLDFIDGRAIKPIDQMTTMVKKELGEETTTAQEVKAGEPKVHEVPKEQKPKKGRPPKKTTKGKALEQHARRLVDLVAGKSGRYSTQELMDMLGLHKNTTLDAMKRAVELDPKVKISKGERRRLYLTYEP